MENVKRHTRSPLLYNWPDGRLDKPMRSFRIYFDHPVISVDHVYRNDGNSSKPHPNKTYLEVNSTVEDKKITIQLQSADVPIVGNPNNDIRIEFTTAHPYIKMEKFIWYVQADARGPEKIAPPSELKKINASFHLAPPPPPVINEPRNNTSSWNETPLIKGKAEAKHTVEILVDGVKVGISQSNEFGDWTFQIRIPLKPRDNKYKFTARLVYSDGEASNESAPVHYTVTDR